MTAIKGELPNIDHCKQNFHTRYKPQITIFELLENKIPSSLVASLPRSMDTVGDIIVVEIPPELEPHKKTVGDAILQSHKNARTVWAKTGAVAGTYRLRKLQLLAGENKTETTHKENGCTYHVDVAKAYFSPRLSHEHSRVTNLVKEGETIIDMFAGVGPFAIQIAKDHQHVSVFAIDINPDAAEYLTENARLNRVEEKVHTLVGDAGHIVKQKLRETADRVIMNLPGQAANYVDSACEALKKTGGVIHFYGFATQENPPESLVTQFRHRVEQSNKKVVKSFYRRVRETAPFESQIVLDAEIQ